MRGLLKIGISWGISRGSDMHLITIIGIEEVGAKKI